MRLDSGHSVSPPPPPTSSPRGLQSRHCRHEAESRETISLRPPLTALHWQDQLENPGIKTSSVAVCPSAALFFELALRSVPRGAGREGAGPGGGVEMGGGGVTFPDVIHNALSLCHFGAPLSGREQACHASTPALRLDGFPKHTPSRGTARYWC